MAGKARAKTQAAEPVCQSKDEVIDAVGRIGELQRMRTRVETEFNDQVAALKETFGDAVTVMDAEIVALTKQVQGWCNAHRAELTDGGKTKTVALPTGEVRWRLAPPSVKIKGVAAALDFMRAATQRFEHFLRLKVEIDKEAMLRDPELAITVPGVTIAQDEAFEILPAEIALESVA